MGSYRIWNDLIIKARTLMRFNEFGVFVSLVAVTSFFAALSREFLTPSTLGGILTIASEVGIIAAGISLLMISGEFDLSVSSVFALSGMTVALLIRYGVDATATMAIALALSALIGAVNGFITLNFNVPSFIATLGMMMFLRGLLLAITGGFPVEVAAKHPLLDMLAGRAMGDLRFNALWFIAVVVALQLILSSTPYGNWCYATGGSARYARASGVTVRRVKLINFILTALLAGFSGAVALARFRIMEPVAGVGLELEAIAAGVIGGVSLSGGIGSIVGAALGSLIIGMVRVGLVLAGAPAYWYTGFIGVILIGVVVIYSLKGPRRAVGE